MGIRWQGNVTANLRTLNVRNQRAMIAAANYVAPQLEQRMKSQAPWTDRTGAARNGLGAKVVTGNNKVAIVLYHSVSYGIYLETRWGGKYSVIRGRLAEGGPMFAETFKRLSGLS